MSNIEAAAYAAATEKARRAHQTREATGSETPAGLDEPPANGLTIQEPKPDGAYAKPLSEIEPEAIDWIWEPWLAGGMLTLLVGDPGLGKSLLSLNLASHLTKAGKCVLLLSAEDNPAVTIRPRAAAAGADLDKLHIVGMRRADTEHGLAFPEDTEALAKLIAEHEAALVVIDPLMAHLEGGLNTWSDHSTRQATAPLHRVAEANGCAILIVHHLNKAKGSDPMYRAGGSIGIPAAVRSAWVLARDPEDPDGDQGTRRVLAHFKSNIGEYAASIAYEIEAVEVADDIVAARLVEVGTSGTTGADLLGAPTGEERTERAEAIEILGEELREGPRSASSVKKAVMAAGISGRTVERAKRALGVKSKKEGFGADGEWVWSLPDKERHDKGRHPNISQVAALDENRSGEPNSEAASSKGRQVADIGAGGLRNTELERLAAKYPDPDQEGAS